MNTDGSPTTLAPVAEGNVKKVVFGPLLDFDGVEAVPTSARYRIDKYTAAGAGPTEVLAWTAIGTPASTMTITVTSAQNSFTAVTDDYEKRRVTLECTYTAVTDLYQDWAEYDVIGNDSYPTLA